MDFFKFFGEGFAVFATGLWALTFGGIFNAISSLFVG